MKFPRAGFGLVLIGLGCGLGVTGNGAESSNAALSVHKDNKAFPLTLSQMLPEVSLRGYGKLSASYWTTPGASIVEIACQNEEKAKLLQAKFLSDLAELPGVNQVAGEAGPEWGVTGQGFVAAWRSQAKVYLLASSTREGLNKLEEEGLSGTKTNLHAMAETDVPMYLDRWDKYGFRFYYGPFKRPPGPDGKDVASYDPAQDFEFAKQSDHMPLVSWLAPNPATAAEGIVNSTWTDWVFRSAQASGLPMGANGVVAETYWLFNRYPDQTLQYQPGFLGEYYGSMNFGISELLSWNATDAHDLELGQWQHRIEQLKAYPNVISWLEPHGEMGHGVADLLVEYGPVADHGFQRFLTQKYKTVVELNKAWETSYAKWDEVRVPEIASFCGWGGDAVDLAGKWRMNYDASYGAASTSVKLDDSGWAEMQAPGYGLVRVLPQKPAVWRRHFTVDPAWHAAHSKVWLYVWDLNDTRGAAKNPNHPYNPNADVQIFLNGQALTENPPAYAESHHTALEVSSVLTAGQNVLTVCLPKGFFNYRVYLTAEEPKNYPDLGPGKNMQWVDFVAWNAWCRGEVVKRGMQAIRQKDPDRPIDLMSPDSYANNLKEAADLYGGNFKNTGYMAGGWSDILPMMMRSSGRPFSAEPGSPAKDLPEFKRFLGLWHTEGVNGIDYFGHLGSILWIPEIRKHFEETLPIIKLIGKYHVPKADVAFLWTTGNRALSEFPWRADPNIILPSNGNCYGIEARMVSSYPRDAVTDGDFARGNAAQYKVIIDTNTSVMDDALRALIEKYVRDGGTFVTFAQTGRHSPAVPNSWPISKLTGYQVLTAEKFRADGHTIERFDPKDPNAGSPIQPLKPAAGQPIYPQTEEWMTKPLAGLRLKKIAPEAQDLLVWQDGTVAAGMRPLGKGWIIQLGCKNDGGRWLGLDPAAFARILDWRGVAKVAGQLEIDTHGTSANTRVPQLRQYVSNNGLYDVWAIWNENDKQPFTVALDFKANTPATAWDVLAKADLPVKDGKLAGLVFEPLQTRYFLTPRNAITEAPLAWLDLQRHWWGGTADTGKAIPEFKSKLTRDVTDDWAFKPLGDADVADPLADPKLNDSAWKRLRLGVFNLPDYPEVHHAVFRKKITVPGEWSHGRVSLWIQSWDAATFLQSGRVFLDGKVLQDWSQNAIGGNDAGGVLKAGSTHLVAIEVTGKIGPLGSRGEAWLAYHPTPESTQDLAGNWEISPDAMKFPMTAKVPGEASGMAARSVVTIDKTHAGRNVVLHGLGDDNWTRAVVINGHWVDRFRHKIGNEFNLNITPWVKFGAPNEIVLSGGPGKFTLSELTLEFHAPNVYP